MGGMAFNSWGKLFKSMTKEEILEDCDDKYSYDLGMDVCTKNAALAAMEEYANQCLIELIEKANKILKDEGIQFSITKNNIL
jgi:hypothetical protein